MDIGETGVGVLGEMCWLAEQIHCMLNTQAKVTLISKLLAAISTFRMPD